MKLFFLLILTQIYSTKMDTEYYDWTQQIFHSYNETISPFRPSSGGLIGELNSYCAKPRLDKYSPLQDIYSVVWALDRRLTLKTHKMSYLRHQSFYLGCGRVLRARLSEVQSLSSVLQASGALTKHDDMYWDQYFQEFGWIDFVFIRDLHANLFTCKVAKQLNVDYFVFRHNAGILLEYLKDIEKDWVKRKPEQGAILTELRIAMEQQYDNIK